MTSIKKDSETKIRIAVPKPMMKAVEDKLTEANLGSVFHVLDVRKNPGSTMLTYKNDGPFSYRNEFVLRGVWIEMTKEVAVRHVVGFATAMVEQMVKKVGDARQDWEHLADYMTLSPES